MNKNNNCDGNHCFTADGEVRILPYGGGGNLILCLSCFNYEIQFRRERNKELAKDCQFELPKWEDLKIYSNS